MAVTQQLVDGLSYLYTRCVIRQDVSPANVLVTWGGRENLRRGPERPLSKPTMRRQTASRHSAAPPARPQSRLRLRPSFSSALPLPTSSQNRDTSRPSIAVLTQSSGTCTRLRQLDSLDRYARRQVAHAAAPAKSIVPLTGTATELTPVRPPR